MASKKPVPKPWTKFEKIKYVLFIVLAIVSIPFWLGVAKLIIYGVVYSVIVKTKYFKKKGIANVGYRPTFNGQNLLLETNIFGINKNLYNKEINVNFIKFIRSEKKFKGLEQLTKQIKIDIIQAKKNVQR